MNNQRIVVSLNLKRTIKIMKLTVLMLAVCLSSVVASTYAQTATLNVSAKNETLEKSVETDRKSSPSSCFSIIWKRSTRTKRSLSMKRMLIFRLCWMLLQLKTGLKYTIKDRHIVLDFRGSSGFYRHHAAES